MINKIFLTAIFFSFVNVAAAQSELIVAYKTPYPIGNTTMTPDQRVFASFHPLANSKIKVVELKPDGTATPYPDMSWQIKSGNNNHYLDSVLGLRSDKNGVLWMLDMGIKDHSAPKLVGWDTKTNRLYKIISLPPPVSNQYSIFNDLAFDDTHDTIYIADEGWNHDGDGSTAALIVVDKKTGEARRLLEGDKSTLPEEVDIKPNQGKPLTRKIVNGSIQRFRIGVDGLVADKHDEWLYYCPANGNKLYRIKTEDLLNKTLSSEDLSRRVELFSIQKPANGGISMDIEGRIWTVDFDNFAVGTIDTKGNYKELVRDPKQLQWPDHVSYGTDGYLYIPASQLHLSADVNEGVSFMKPPYLTLKIKALAPGITGR